MSDPIKMTGRLLTFNKITLNNTMFSENCNFSYPDKVPFVRDFKNNDPSSVLGSANIYKDEKGLYCDVEIVGLDHDFLKENRSCELSIGGYYDKVKLHEENGIAVIDEARLLSINTTDSPADDETKIRIMEE